MGYPAIGFDLNPIMVVVAKARLLPVTEASSLVPLGHAIVDNARKLEGAAKHASLNLTCLN
jgi:hypothetical protein